MEQHAGKIKVDFYLTSYIKMNSKWIIYLNVGTKTIKLFKENIGVYIFSLFIGPGLLKYNPRGDKEKVDKELDLKTSVLKNQPLKSEMSAHRAGEIFAKYLKDLYSEYINESQNSSQRR